MSKSQELLAAVCDECDISFELDDLAIAAAERYFSALPSTDLTHKMWIDRVHENRRLILEDEESFSCRSCEKVPTETRCPYNYDQLTLAASARLYSQEFPTLYENILAELRKENPMLDRFERAYSRKHAPNHPPRRPAPSSRRDPPRDVNCFDDGRASPAFEQDLRQAEQRKQEKLRQDRAADRHVDAAVTKHQQDQEALLKQPPPCQCGLQTQVQYVKAGDNAGRPFVGCPNWKSPDKCKFFEFLDEQGQQEKQERLARRGGAVGRGGGRGAFQDRGGGYSRGSASNSWATKPLRGGGSGASNSYGRGGSYGQATSRGGY